jgi:predicted component of type VI protein secretion system
MLLLLERLADRYWDGIVRQEIVEPSTVEPKSFIVQELEQLRTSLARQLLTTRILRGTGLVAVLGACLAVI